MWGRRHRRSQGQSPAPPAAEIQVQHFPVYPVILDLLDRQVPPELFYRGLCRSSASSAVTGSSGLSFLSGFLTKDSSLKSELGQPATPSAWGMLIVIGIQFITLGLLAEIMVRAYHESSESRSTLSARSSTPTPRTSLSAKSMKILMLAPEPFFEPRGTPIAFISESWPWVSSSLCPSGHLPSCQDVRLKNLKIIRPPNLFFIRAVRSVRL